VTTKKEDKIKLGTGEVFQGWSLPGWYPNGG